MKRPSCRDESSHWRKPPSALGAFRAGMRLRLRVGMRLRVRLSVRVSVLRLRLRLRL